MSTRHVHSHEVALLEKNMPSNAGQWDVRQSLILCDLGKLTFLAFKKAIAIIGFDFRTLCVKIYFLLLLTPCNIDEN